jgi:hypothetical protein
MKLAVLTGCHLLITKPETVPAFNLPPRQERMLDIQLYQHALLTLALHRDQWTSFGPGQLTPRETVLDPHRTGGRVKPTDGRDV